MVKKSKRKIRNPLKKITLWFLYICLGIFMSSIFVTLAYKWIPPPITPLMIIRLTEQIKDGEKLQLKKDWVSLKNISPNLPLAVIASEDQHFLIHHGFDMEAIQKAQKHNKRSKRTRGASSISQQTAKNVFLWPQRSWVRKGLEVYFTMLIEGIWGKKRIMEVYLNVIEWGNGIYGAEKASEVYFNKSAKKLNRSQAARLAVCLPNPRKYNAGHPGPFVMKRQRWAVRQMGYIEPVFFDKELFYGSDKTKKK